jgi:hypothetical protein
MLSCSLIASDYWPNLMPSIQPAAATNRIRERASADQRVVVEASVIDDLPSRGHALASVSRRPDQEREEAGQAVYFHRRADTAAALPSTGRILAPLRAVCPAQVTRYVPATNAHQRSTAEDP